MDTTDREIQEIREINGAPHDRCTTCCKAPNSPYRRTDIYGVMIEGCIDAIHGPHADAWHNRESAVQIREKILKNLKRMLDLGEW